MGATIGSGQNARATVARAFCPPPFFLIGRSCCATNQQQREQSMALVRVMTLPR